MVKTIAILLMLFFVPVQGASVPPVLGPNDVPFAYDPNLCTASIMDWQIAEPNIAAIYSVGAHNKWGLDIELTTNDPNILIQKLAKAKDPEGGWNQYWQCMFTYSVEGVHYIEITVEDKVGRTDCRTLLVLCVSDDTPFIFPGSPPVIISDARIKDAQRFWQFAKKNNYPVTKPTTVLN